MFKKVLTLALILAIAPLASVGQDVEGNNNKKAFRQSSDSVQKSPHVIMSLAIEPANAQSGDVVTLTINTRIADGWHIGSIGEPDGPQAGFPTQFEFEPVGLTAVDEQFSPSNEPEEFTTATSEIQNIHSGQFEWTRRYQIDENADSWTGKLTVTFQACNDTICMPPKSFTFQVGRSNDSATHSETAVAEPVDRAGEIVIPMETCQASRPTVIQSMGGILAGVFLNTGERKDRLVRKGTVKVDGEDITIYLPRFREYTIENGEPDNSRFTNRTTYLSVDQNSDSVLDDYESFACNLPIRIKDTMFEVLEIDPDGKSITLRKVDMLLTGVVMGRRCPDFSYETVDGKVVSNTSILGKVTILDVWAVT